MYVSRKHKEDAWIALWGAAKYKASLTLSLVCTLLSTKGVEESENTRHRIGSGASVRRPSQ